MWSCLVFVTLQVEFGELDRACLSISVGSTGLARLDSKGMGALLETVFTEEASHATSWREKKPK
jgi:hypothetical protein